MDDVKELFAQSVRALVSRDGSDIHFKTGSQVIFRIHRALQIFLSSPNITDVSLREFFYSIIDDEQRALFEKRKFLFFRYGYTVNSKSYNFRGTAFCEKDGLALSFRLISETNKTFQDLRLPDILSKVCNQRQGLFLVVGPSGHGKSTTLAAMIEYINTTKKKMILTIENPIEFVYTPKESYIHQRAMNIDTHTFSDAVGAALRSDLDVVMVGEMNSIESIQSVLTLSEVGHLTFSTLHSNSSSEVIHRIIDVFPEQRQNQIRQQLSQVLIGIFSIRLLPRVQGGLVPAYEILFNTNAISNLIRENQIHLIPSTIQTSSSVGMVDLNSSLASLVHQDEITKQTAEEFSDDIDSLQRLL